MKKALAIMSLLLLVGLVGCQQSTSTSTTPPVPANTCAASVGSLAFTSLYIDNISLGAVGVSGAMSAQTTLATPVYGTDGWWSAQFTYGSAAVTVNFRVWNTSGTEIVNSTGLNALTIATTDKLWIYTTWVVGSTTMSFGTSKDNPLKFAGIYSTSSTNKSISGPIALSGTDEDGTSYSIAVTYSTVTLSSSGYPNGTVTVSVTSGGQEIMAGSLVCIGTNSATFTFTSGYSGSYAVNLDTGVVTAASL